MPQQTGTPIPGTPSRSGQQIMTARALEAQRKREAELAAKRAAEQRYMQTVQRQQGSMGRDIAGTIGMGLGGMPGAMGGAQQISSPLVQALMSYGR